MRNKFLVIFLVLVIGISYLGCSPTDSWTEPAYFEELWAKNTSGDWFRVLGNSTDGGGEGLWEVDGNETELITADELDIQNKSILNVLDIDGVDIGTLDGTVSTHTTAIGILQGASHTQNTDTGLGVLGTKNPPIDADKVVYRDSANSDNLVTSTWTQIKAFFKTYFDTMYASLSHAITHGVGGNDTVFPADPNADKYLMWDDDLGQLSWEESESGMAVHGNEYHDPDFATETDLIDLQDIVDTIQDDLTALNSTVSSLNATVSGHTVDISNLQGNVTSLEGDISTLEGVVSGHISDIGTLQSAVSTLQSDFSSLNSTVAGLVTDVGDLQSDIGDLISAIGDLESDVSDLQGAVSDLESRMDAAEANIDYNTGNITELKTFGIVFEVDSSSAITTGFKRHLEIPFDCTVISWTIMADVAGAIQIDVWKDTYANFPPTDADSMCSGKEPKIVATNQKNQDLDISDWTTTSISAGDILAFNVDSCTTITKVTLTITATRVI